MKYRIFVVVPKFVHFDRKIILVEHDLMTLNAFEKHSFQVKRICDQMSRPIQLHCRKRRRNLSWNRCGRMMENGLVMDISDVMAKYVYLPPEP